MDIQFWIWLIVIVITLIARASKKKPQEFDGDNSTGPTSSQRPEMSSKPMTFEELLREIQASKAPAPPVPTKPVSTYVDYDDDIEEEQKDLESTSYNYDDDSIYKTYEKAKAEAFSRPSLEETVKLQDTVVRFDQFKGYQQEQVQTQGADILQQFHDPEGFRKAFIMSEILKRKF